MRRLLTRTIAAVSLVCLGLAVCANARPQASLSASFSPERLGAGTTIRIGFRIDYPPGEPPLPVTEVQLLLPAGLGIAGSELGLDNCLAAPLERYGPSGCPHNSLVGHGSALAEVPFGSRFVSEHVRISLFSGPLQSGHPQLLFMASGNEPVIADLVFSSLVLPENGRFGGVIDTTLPLVPSVPEGPDVALTRLQTTIGPAGILYSERVGGRTVTFRPKGVLLPQRCPRGGFTFAIRLHFADGAWVATTHAVACPRSIRGGSKAQSAA